MVIKPAGSDSSRESNGTLLVGCSGYVEVACPNFAKQELQHNCHERHQQLRRL